MCVSPPMEYGLPGAWGIQNENFILRPNFGPNLSQIVGLEGQKVSKKLIFSNFTFEFQMNAGLTQNLGLFCQKNSLGRTSDKYQVLGGDQD